MDTPCRVLILNERDPLHPAAGGAETHVSEIFGRLASRGFEITLATSGFPGAPTHERFADLEIRRLGRLALYYPRVAWTCARETRRGAYDVVVECLNKIPFYAPAYSRAPVLALCHHLFGEVAFQQVAWPLAAGVWLSERMIPLLYRRTTFLAISESSRDDLIGRGIAAEHIRVSHCGVNPSGLSIDPDKPRPCRVAYLGRLEPYKRVDILLRAMAQLGDRFPDAEILIIGRGSARPELERLAGELGIRPRTRFTGFVTDPERNRLLSECRVCACPSGKEGWGLTVIEANSVGTPVVATDVPGLRDSVRHGETGFLVNGSVASFAERIGELLEDDRLAARQSRAALAWSRQFDWDRAALEMIDALAVARGSR